MLKSVKNYQNQPFFVQVMNFFVKNDFMILAKFRVLNLWLQWSDFKIFKTFKKLCPFSFYKLN